MRTFDYSNLADRTWDNEIVSYLTQIHEYKGKQDLYIRQKPVELERLIEIARIQSTEASNRIEGIVTPATKLLRRRKKPKSTNNKNTRPRCNKRGLFLNSKSSSYFHYKLYASIMSRIPTFRPSSKAVFSHSWTHGLTPMFSQPCLLMRHSVSAVSELHHHRYTQQSHKHRH